MECLTEACPPQTLVHYSGACFSMRTKPMWTNAHCTADWWHVSPMSLLTGQLMSHACMHGGRCGLLYAPDGLAIMSWDLSCHSYLSPSQTRTLCLYPWTVVLQNSAMLIHDPVSGTGRGFSMMWRHSLMACTWYSSDLCIISVDSDAELSSVLTLDSLDSTTQID